MQTEANGRTITAVKCPKEVCDIGQSDLLLLSSAESSFPSAAQVYLGPLVFHSSTGSYCGYMQSCLSVVKYLGSVTSHRRICRGFPHLPSRHTSTTYD